MFGYLKLFSIAVTIVFPSFHDFRLIHLSLARFNSFLSSHRFVLDVLCKKDFTFFFILITVFFVFIR